LDKHCWLDGIVSMHRQVAKHHEALLGKRIVPPGWARLWHPRFSDHSEAQFRGIWRIRCATRPSWCQQYGTHSSFTGLSCNRSELYYATFSQWTSLLTL